MTCAHSLRRVTACWTVWFFAHYAAQAYAPEEDSFAAILNHVISDLTDLQPPKRYHDNEDRLAQYLVEHLGWNIRKENGRWVGEDYDVILEQGAWHDADQADLTQAAAGRIHAAMDRRQMHFDDMERSHQRMLAAVLTIILYHRGSEVGYQLGSR